MITLKEFQTIVRSKNSLIQFYIELCNELSVKDREIQSFLPEDNRTERIISEIEAIYQNNPNSEKRSDLFGVPVGIKDLFRVDGFDTKCGSTLPSKLFTGTEAHTATLLKKAGCIIFGKTVTTEFAYFEPGPTKNPCNLNHTPGGSSSGSAAAVSAGFVPIALGTQTIGSITRPAAFCGVLGYKPTYDRINKSGVIPFSDSFDHVGVFAENFDYLNAVCEVLVENWNLDYTFSYRPVLAIPMGKYLNQADIEILNAFSGYIENLEREGFIIKKINLFDDIDEINAIHSELCALEFFQVHKEWFRLYENLYRPKTKEMIITGSMVKPSRLTTIFNKREKTIQQIKNLMEKEAIDFWITPATLSTAPLGVNSTGSPLMNLPWTFAGLPTLTFPIGKNENNLPIGIQLIAKNEADERLISFSKNINRKYSI